VDTAGIHFLVLEVFSALSLTLDDGPPGAQGGRGDRGGVEGSKVCDYEGPPLSGAVLDRRRRVRSSGDYDVSVRCLRKVVSSSHRGSFRETASKMRLPSW